MFVRRLGQKRTYIGKPKRRRSRFLTQETKLVTVFEETAGRKICDIVFEPVARQ